MKEREISIKCAWTSWLPLWAIRALSTGDHPETYGTSLRISPSRMGRAPSGCYSLPLSLWPPSRLVVWDAGGGSPWQEKIPSQLEVETGQHASSSPAASGGQVCGRSEAGYWQCLLPRHLGAENHGNHLQGHSEKMRPKVPTLSTPFPSLLSIPSHYRSKLKQESQREKRRKKSKWKEVNFFSLPTLHLLQKEEEWVSIRSNNFKRKRKITWCWKTYKGLGKIQKKEERNGEGGRRELHVQFLSGDKTKSPLLKG